MKRFMRKKDIFRLKSLNISHESQGGAI